MARILIGNIKGPAGPTGPQGKQGIQGPVGPQGPLPALINNALATQAGVAALDAVMGKTLQDQINQQNSDLTNVISYTQVDDANKAVKFGRYRVSGSGTNIPSWGGGVDLLVIPYENGVKAQIAIFNSTTPKLAIRAMSSGAYGNWIEYAQKDDLKAYFPDYFGSQITNDVMNLNNKINGVWYGGVTGSTNNLPTGVKNALVRLLKYSSSAAYVEVIDMDSGVRHSNLWHASAGWLGWK